MPYPGHRTAVRVVAMEQGSLWDGAASVAVPAVILVAQQGDEAAGDFVHRTRERLTAVAKQGVLVTSAVLAISSWSAAGAARAALASVLLHRLSQDSGTELVLHAPETLGTEQRAELMALAGVLCETSVGGTIIVVRFYGRDAVDFVPRVEACRSVVLSTVAANANR